MYLIKKAEQLTGPIYLMDVEAPRIAKHCLPGQFIIAKIDEKGERVPLTICDYDKQARLRLYSRLSVRRRRGLRI